MKRIPMAIALVVVTAGLLSACGREDYFYGVIHSPDGKHSIELRKCSAWGFQGNIGKTSFTEVTVLPAGQRSACFERTRHYILRFDAPADVEKLSIRWTSNTTIQASYPGFPPGKFPYSFSQNAESKIQLNP